MMCVRYFEIDVSTYIGMSYVVFIILLKLIYIQKLWASLFFRLSESNRP
jgi:hypothetical protein